jgi:signal transduction histidine kinase
LAHLAAVIGEAAQLPLNKIAKHAAASRVDIWLKYQASSVELVLCDDGRGFDP